MFFTKKQWIKPKLTPSNEQLATLANECQLSEQLIYILYQRGYDNPKKIKNFLNPTLEEIHDPFALYDMDKAVERIILAIDQGEKICVYGDYDVDGITSTAIMYETLLQLGADVQFYIPDRFEDGYGPNKEVYQKLIKQQVQLIITVDNGVAGHEAIEFAMKQGVDVIISDHHELPSQLPSAYAIIHPRHPQGNYPFANLAGAGVALKFASALLEELPTELLDLAALGTIADVMPLIEENRILVKFGLKVLQQTSRVGLQALYKVAKIEASTISTETVGFYLAPRLNAVGRLKNARLAVELLTTYDEQKAQALAQEIDNLNEERQLITEQVLAEALQQVSTKNLVNVLAGTDWHEGILGVVAGKIKELTSKPTLVFSIDSQTKIAKGSGRSIEAFDMFTALQPYQELLLSFGGHHLACGLSLMSDNLKQLQLELNQAAKQQQIMQAPKEELVLAGQLALDDIELTLLEELEKMAPFGQANPRPVFKLTNYQLKNIWQLGKKKNHLKLQLAGQNINLDALQFNFDTSKLSLYQQFKDDLSLVGYLEQNTWQNKKQVQIMLVDLGLKHLPIIDQRRQNLVVDFFKDDLTYGIFDMQLYQKLTQRFGTTRQIIKLPSEQLHVKQLVLVDCPNNLVELSTTLQKNNFEELRLWFYAKHRLTDMPSRQDFAKLYRLLQQLQKFKVKEQLAFLIQSLKLTQNQVIFMLQVFLETKFVKIENGWLQVVRNPQHCDLKQTKIYYHKSQEPQVQAFLLQSDFLNLKSWIYDQLSNK